MEWVGGTKKVITLIDELIKSGNLINVYSEEYFKSFNTTDINPKVYQRLIKDHGNEFIGHLLIGCFHGDNGHKLRDLLYQYEPATHENRWDYTCDCFVFINLKKQLIMYMGITGRKRHYNEFIVGDSNNSYNDFEKHDHLGIISRFRDLMENEFAYYLNQLYYDSYPNEYYEYVLGKNGRYHSEYDVDDIEEDSDDGYTKEELDKNIQESEEWVENANETEKILKRFFPEFSQSNIFE